MEKIEELYNLALYHNLVKNKTEFANFIGSNKATLSHAFKRTGGVNPTNIETKAKHALLKAGIDADSVTASGDIMSGYAQKNLPSPQTDTGQLIAEMAAQREMYASHMSRLLTIIENMQK